MIIELSNLTIKNLSNDQQNKELIIGFFDGIHKGHLNLFKDTKNKSLLTFVSIPRKINQIYKLEERLEQLEQFNFENIYLYDILSENITAEKFIKKYLLPLKINKIIVGRNFNFGSDFKDYNELKKYFDVEVIEIDNNYNTTKIKNLVAKNNFDKLNTYLINDFYRSGKVVPGNQVARTLGFPTANIEIDHKLLPLKDGVYITKTKIENDSNLYKSITYIGVPKTMDIRTFSMLETHIIDYNGDLYGKKIKVYFYKYIAPNKKFMSQNSLIHTVNKYIEQSRNYKK